MPERVRIDTKGNTPEGSMRGQFGVAVAAQAHIPLGYSTLDMAGLIFVADESNGRPKFIDLSTGMTYRWVDGDVEGVGKWQRIADMDLVDVTLTNPRGA